MKRLAFGLALALSFASAPLEGQSPRTMTASRQLGRESDLDVRVTYGAGRFTVRSAPEGMLYRMKLRYDEDQFDPISEFDGHNLHLGVDARGHNVRVGKHEGGDLEVELTSSTCPGPTLPRWTSRPSRWAPPSSLRVGSGT